MIIDFDWKLNRNKNLGTQQRIVKFEFEFLVWLLWPHQQITLMESCDFVFDKLLNSSLIQTKISTQKKQDDTELTSIR